MSLQELRKRKELQQQATNALFSQIKYPDRERVGKIDHAVNPKDVKVEVEELPKECPIPEGYSAINRYEVDKLMWYKDHIIEKGIVAFDYESNGDPGDKEQKTHEQYVVGVSFCCEIGTAVYLPIAHDGYSGNWDMDWLVENFLKPVLEHPDVYVIAHHVAVEYTLSILNGVDLYPKARQQKVMDTMYMIKAIAPNELVDAYGNIELGLKPATKALLADENGMVHGLLHVDDIKSFKETVGYVEEKRPTGRVTKTGKPEMRKTKIYRTFNQLPVDKHSIDYACSDSDWSLGLYYKLKAMIDADEDSEALWMLLYELSIPFAMIMAEIQMTGWRTNPKVRQEYREISQRMLYGYEDENGQWVRGLEEELTDELRKILIEKKVPVQFDEKTGLPIVPAGAYPMGICKEGPYKGQEAALIIKNSQVFSWKSTKQLQWLYYHVLKFKPRKWSPKTGLPATDRETLDELIEIYGDDSRFMQVLKKKRKYDKLLSTYVDGYEKALKEDNRLHSNLKRVDTWRLSSSSPNLQNIPRAGNDELGIRKMFEAPKYDVTAPEKYEHWNKFMRPPEIMFKNKLSGQTLYISADYSQIELRVLAVMAQEESMLNAFRTGIDIHSQTAKDVNNLDCDVKDVKKLYKDLRSSAKAINFGIVYGISEVGLAAHPDMKGKYTVEQCAEFIRRYKQRYPNIDQYIREQIDFARKHKYTVDMFGHRRPLPGINHPWTSIRTSFERKAMNTPIQATAANILCMGMVAIRDEAPKRFPPGVFKMVMPIHDDLISEVPIEYAVEALKFQKEIQEQEIEGINCGTPYWVPIIAEPAVGVTWGRSLEVKYEGDKAYALIDKEKGYKAFEGYEHELEIIQKAGFILKEV
jgi:DNA polymerase I-like protein with 3'-5' exonuclease and polymerase domains